MHTELNYFVWPKDHESLVKSWTSVSPLTLPCFLSVFHWESINSSLRLARSRMPKNYWNHIGLLSHRKNASYLETKKLKKFTHHKQTQSMKAAWISKVLQKSLLRLHLIWDTVFTWDWKPVNLVTQKLCKTTISWGTWLNHRILYTYQIWSYRLRFS